MAEKNYFHRKLFIFINGDEFSITSFIFALNIDLLTCIDNIRGKDMECTQGGQQQGRDFHKVVWDIETIFFSASTACSRPPS